jgi:rhamnosyltransferase
MGCETLVIPRNEFNHGATRERSRRHMGRDIAVMMTPDAYAQSPEFLSHLISPLVLGEAAVFCPSVAEGWRRRA